MKLSSRTIFLLLILILLLGAGLRLYQLGKEDLWYDEICTVNFATTPWSNLKLEPFDFSHFLFNNLVMHVWLKLGTNIIIIRLFSALVGIASIAVLFLIGSHLFDTKVGLLSALFLAFSSYHMYYSQEARAYALQLFLILWMVYFFYRATEQPQFRFWIICSILSIFAIYLQAFTLFSWIALNSFVFWRLRFCKEKCRIFPWLISQSIVLILCIPYFVYLARPEMRYYFNWIPQPTITDISNTFELYIIGWLYWLVPMVFRQALVPLSLFLLLFSGLTFIISRQKIKEQPKRYQGLMLTWFMFLIPLILFYMISFKKPIFLSYRYSIVALPFFYLLISYGISNLRYRVLQGIVVILLLIGMIAGLYTYHTEVKKIQWSKVAQYLNQNLQKQDLIYIYQSYWDRSLSYYLKSSIPIQPIERMDTLYTQTSAEIAKHPRIWLVIVTFKDETSLHDINATLELLYKQHQTAFATSSNQPGQALVDLILYSNPANREHQ